MICKEFMNISDKEIIEALKEVFTDITRVENIMRYKQYNEITCRIYTKNGPLIGYIVNLNQTNLYSYDFDATKFECFKWKNFLWNHSYSNEKPNILTMISPEMKQYLQAEILKEYVEELKDFCSHNTISTSVVTNCPVYVNPNGIWADLLEDFTKQYQENQEEQEQTQAITM